MPTISFSDNCNRFDNYINNNNNIQYVCGNPFIISILLSLIIIIIVNINYDNCFTQMIYSVLFVLPIILLSNKIIKCNYMMKRDGGNPFKDSTNVIKSGKGIIGPRVFGAKQSTIIDSKNSSDDDIDMIAGLLEETI
jgi:hypothetical protein